MDRMHDVPQGSLAPNGSQGTPRRVLSTTQERLSRPVANAYEANAWLEGVDSDGPNRLLFRRDLRPGRSRARACGRGRDRCHASSAGRADQLEGQAEAA